MLSLEEIQKLLGHDYKVQNYSERRIGFGRIICVSTVRQKTQSHKKVHKSS